MVSFWTKRLSLQVAHQVVLGTVQSAQPESSTVDGADGAFVVFLVAEASKLELAPILRRQTEEQIAPALALRAVIRSPAIM